MPVSDLLAALPQAGRSPGAPDPASAGAPGARRDPAANAAAGPQSPFQRFLRELRRAALDRPDVPRASDAARGSVGTNDPQPAGRAVREARPDDPSTAETTDAARSDLRDETVRSDATDDPRASAAGDGSDSPQDATEPCAAAEDGTDGAIGSELDDIAGTEDEAAPVVEDAAIDEAPDVSETEAPDDTAGLELPPGLRAIFAQLAAAVQSGSEGDDVPILSDDGLDAAAGQAPPGLVALWNRWTATGSIAPTPTDGCSASEGCTPIDAPPGPVDIAGNGDGAGVLPGLDPFAATDPSATHDAGDDSDATNDGTLGGVPTERLANGPAAVNAAPVAITPSATNLESDPREASRSERRTDRTGRVDSAEDGAGDSAAIVSNAAIGPNVPSAADGSTTGPALPADDVPITEAVPSDGPAADLDATVSRGTTAAATGPAPGAGRAGGARSVDGELTVPPHVDPQRFADRLARFVHEAHGGDRTLRVRLEPPDLGALRIEVSLRDGALSARLDVQTEAARRTLVEHLPLLHEALARQGTALERVDVQREEAGERGFADDWSSAGRDGFGSFAGFGGSDGDSGGNGPSRAPFGAGPSDPEPATAAPSRTGRPGRELSGLDIRV